LISISGSIVVQQRTRFHRDLGGCWLLGCAQERTIDKFGQIVQRQRDGKNDQTDGVSLKNKNFKSTQMKIDTRWKIKACLSDGVRKSDERQNDGENLANSGDDVGQHGAKQLDLRQQHDNCHSKTHPKITNNS
jgi:hypothetical protein